MNNYINKLSSKIFYWPFQGSTSFVDLLCFFSLSSFVDLLCFFLSCVCYAFVCVCLYVPCGHLLGKGWPPGSRLWCLTVSLPLSHWYPGSGGVLDCINSWSLHPYLLSYLYIEQRNDQIHLCRIISNHISINKQSRHWSGSSYKSCLIWVCSVWKCQKASLWGEGLKTVN